MRNLVARLSPRRPRAIKRRPLLLQCLEERILWDATMAPDGDVQGAGEEPVEEPVVVALAKDDSALDTLGEAEDPLAAGADTAQTDADSADEYSEVGDGEEDPLDTSAALSEADLEPSDPLDTDDEADSAVGVEDGAAADDPAETAAQQNTPQRLVVVDSRIQDYESLLADIGMGEEESENGNEDEQPEPSYRLVVLDNDSSGIDRIGQALSEMESVDELHIFSHGKDGQVALGSDVVNAGNLDDFLPRLERWRDALSEEADILIYGCDVAGTETGEFFGQRIADATGADVALSSDATGSAEHGGDWDLEVVLGDISADPLVSASGTPSWSGLLAPVPTVTIDMPAEEMIEETATFTVTFENTSATDPGYGPFVDVYIPVGLTVVDGPDIAGANVGVLTWDATQSVWVTSGGLSIDPVSGKHPFDQTNSTGQALLMDSGVNDGDKWYIIELPFGSFVPDQPAVDISFTVELDEAPAEGGAVVGVPLTVSARGGFRFGEDATDNPNNDPPVQGTEAEASITPILFEIEKTSNAPESQTPTGPNFPVEYTITVDIAPDQELDTMVVTDLLPDSAQYRDDLVVMLNGVDVTASVLAAAGYDAPIPFQPNLTPDNDFILPIANAVGNTTDDVVELTITYSAFYGELDANGTDVLGNYGQDSSATNTATVDADYDHPIDGTQDVSDTTDYTHELNALTVIKTSAITDDVGGNGLSPSDTITYTIEFEISDYFALDSVVVNDILGDGQTYDDTFNPTIELFQNGSTINGNWDNGTLVGGTGTAFSVVRDTVTTGTTAITLNVSELLGLQLAGDLFDGDTGTDEDTYIGGRTGAGTVGTITFQAIVDEEYLNPSIGDASVDLGDTVGNEVSMEAALLDPDSSEPGGGDYQPAPGGDTTEDGSEASETAENLDSAKGIAYINGEAYTGQEISPGDVLVYQLTLTLPRADTEDLVITDYLPLPLFDADSITPTFQNGPGDAVDPMTDLIIGGLLFYGPGHTLQDAAPFVGPDPHDPDVTIDGDTNSIAFDFGSFDSTYADPVTIDILITVEVENEPFADALFITNQAQWQDANSQGETFSDDDTVQIQVAEPDLVNSIFKGVIAVDDTNNNGVFDPDPSENLADLEVNAPGSAESLAFVGDGIVTAAEYLANPMDSNLTGVDGGDIVTFAIAVANTGAGNAWGIRVEDNIPDGFVLPTDISELNLKLYSGAGNRVTDSPDFYTAELAGSNLIIQSNLVPLDGDRLGEEDDGTPGNDIVIITYDLVVANTAESGSTHINTAAITYYTGQFVDIGDPDANFVDPNDPPSDDASVEILTPSVTKNLVGTSIDEGPNEANEAVIGELVTYEIVLTVPESTSVDMMVEDLLDQGLALVQIDNITSSSGDLDIENFTALTGLFPIDDPADGPVTSGLVTYTPNTGGQDTLTIDLGTVTNNNTDNATPENITITYTAVVLNVPGNQTGTGLNNDASAEWLLEGEVQQTDPASAPNVLVIEPVLEVDKRVSLFDPTTTTDEPSESVIADAGDTVYFSITLRHDSTSQTDAYSVSFTDLLQVGLDVSTATIHAVEDSDGALTTADFLLSPVGLITFNPGGPNVNADGTIDVMAYGPPGREITVVVEVDIIDTIIVGSEIPNGAIAQWSSLPRDTASNSDLSAFVDDADMERDGSEIDSPSGGTVNDYHHNDGAFVTIDANLVDKYIVNSEIFGDEAGEATGDGQGQPPNDSDGINRGREAVIGEYLIYEIVVTFADGVSPDSVLHDTLDPGLVLVSIDSIDTSLDLNVENFAALSSSLPIDDPADSPLVSYTHNAGAGSDQFSIELGDVETPFTGNLLPNTLTVRYTVMVTDVPASTGNGAGTAGTQLNNSATLTWEDPVDGTQTTDPDVADTVEVLEPDLDVVKEVEVDGPGDAGDVVTYTFTISHAPTSEADAYEVTIDDTFDTQLVEPFTLVSAEISGGVDVSGMLSLAGGVLTTTGKIDLLQDEELTIVVTGVLADTVNPGDIIGNEVDIGWTSIDNAINGDAPRVDYSGFVPGAGEDQEREYTDSALAEDIVVPDPAITKTLVGSDVTDPTNTATDATIGEIVTYEVQVSLPEGVVNDATIVDLLDPGLEFLDIVTVHTSTLADITTDLAGGLGAVTGVTTGDATTGQTVTFDLGNLVIAGDNGPFPSQPAQGLDAIIIRYRAVVVDETLNTAGNTVANSATFEYSNDAGDQSLDPVSAEDVTLVEPDLEVIKTVGGLADGVALEDVDAGDEVTYAITIQHSGGSTATAYDVTLADMLPAEIDFSGVDFNFGNNVVVADNGGAPLGTIDFAIVGGVLQFAVGGNTASDSIDMDIGRVITVELTGALLDAPTDAGETITNLASVDWSSLPEGHENDGQPDERGDPSDADDVYHDDDDALIIVATPSFDKALTDATDTDYTIGETVEYDLVVTVPEGTTNNVVLSDDVPDGMAFLGATLVTLAADSDYLATDFNGTVEQLVPTTTGQDGADVTLDLGDIVATGSTGTADNQFVIRVELLVLDVPGNVGITGSQTELENTAGMAYDVPDGAGGFGTIDETTDPELGDDPATDTTVEVVEPILEIVKVVNELPDGTALEDATAGDEIRYTLTISHTGESTTDAYDVVVTDPIPEEIDATLVTAMIGATDVSGSFSIAGDELTTTGPVTLELGQTLVITVTGTLLDAPTAAGEEIPNTASLAWSTLDGENITDLSPDITGDTDSERGDDADHGNEIYVDEDDALITIATPSFDKRLTDETDTDYTIGEVVSYDLVVTAPEGTTNNVVLTDDVPDGMAFLGANLVTLAADSDYLAADFNGSVEQLVPATGGQDGEDVTFDLGDVVTAGDNDDTNNVFVIRVELLVLDVPGNVGITGSQTELENTAGMAYDVPDGTGGFETIDETTDPELGDDPATDTTVAVVEPILEVIKDVDIAGNNYGAPGDAMTYTITVSHVEPDSTTDAEDVSITDTLPDEFIPTDFTAMLGAADVSGNFDLTGQEFTTLTPVDIAEGEVLTIVFMGSIDAALDAATVVNNTADIEWSTVDEAAEVDSPFIDQGDDGDDSDREYTDTDDAEFSTVDFEKEITGTSLDDTTSAEYDPANPDLAIGEIITYRLTATLPNGADVPVIISDTMPDNLEVISATVISIGGDISGSTIPVGGMGTFGGNSVSFDFGTVTVLDDDVADEDDNRIVVEIMAAVLNDGANAAGQVKTNEAVFDFGGATTLTDAEDADIVEPTAAITKTFYNLTNSFEVELTDAGNVVTVRLEVSNGGDATLYDVAVEDVLDTTFFDPATATAVGPLNGFDFSVTGNTVLFENGTLEAGQTLTLAFQVTVIQAVTPGQTVDNTATIRGDSLPGGHPNDDDPAYDREYTNDASDDLRVPGIGIQKAFLVSDNEDTPDEPGDGTPDLNIGEIATYSLRVRLPEGTVPSLEVVDLLPEGMLYIDGTARLVFDPPVFEVPPPFFINTDPFSGTITDTGGNPLADGDFIPDVNGAAGDGNDIAINFGEIIANGSTLGLQFFFIELQAVVLDVDTNQSGTELTNTASADVDPTDLEPASTSNPVTIEVIDPDLDISKTFYNASGTQEVEVVPGGTTVMVELVLRNTGDGPAYDMVVEDPLDPTKFAIGTVAPVSTASGFSFALVGNTVRYSGDGPLMPGESARFRYTVQVVEGFVSVVNTANVAAGDTVPGESEFERDHDGAMASDNLLEFIEPVPPDPPTPPGPGPDPGPDPFPDNYRYDVFDLQREEIYFEQPEAPQMPYMASGQTNAGATVRIQVFGEGGELIGDHIVVADAAGNWMLSLPSTIPGDTPYRAHVTVTPNMQQAEAPAIGMARTFYTPVLNGEDYVSSWLTVEEAAQTTSERLAWDIDHLEHPIAVISRAGSGPHPFTAVTTIQSL